MSGRRIDVVLVKLCAVVILVISMQSLAGYVGYFASSGENSFVLVGSLLLNFGIPTLIAAALWFFPATVIGDTSSRLESSPEDADLALLAVTLIGLYTLVFGIIDLSYYESIRLYEREMADPNNYGTYSSLPSTTAGRISCVIQIIIGLVLLVGKRSIVQFLKGARKAGVDPS